MDATVRGKHITSINQKAQKTKKNTKQKIKKNTKQKDKKLFFIILKDILKVVYIVLSINLILIEGLIIN